jgi:hypothetical protein
MADLDRRGEYRAAVFEQKREVGGRRVSERQDQSEDHEKAAPEPGRSSHDESARTTGRLADPFRGSGPALDPAGIDGPRPDLD